MSLCETCIHVVTDGKKPVSCMALVKYIPCDSCMFYEKNPWRGKNNGHIIDFFIYEEGKK